MRHCCNICIDLYGNILLGLNLPFLVRGLLSTTGGGLFFIDLRGMTVYYRMKEYGYSKEESCLHDRSFQLS